MPFLLERLKGSKPKEVVLLLFALKDLKLIEASSLRANQTEIHQALQHTFDRVGSRASLNANITKLDAADSTEHRKIGLYRDQVKKYLTL